MSVYFGSRIGYIVNEFPLGSDERLLNELVELERCGVNLRVFSLRRPEMDRPPSRTARLRARVAYLPDRQRLSVARPPRAVLPLQRHDRQITILPPVTRTNEASWIASQVLGSGISHLHAYSAERSSEIARETACLTGIPFSFSVEASDLGPGGVRWRELRARARMAQFIVTRSEASVGLVADICGANVLHKCHRMYDGIDLAELPFSSEVRRSDALLSIAGPPGHEGLTDLLAAIAAVHERGRSTHLTVVAPESAHAALLRDAERRGLKESVHVVSMPEENALLGLMRMHTLLVAPWTATSVPAEVPKVFLQAMALGLPVIASDLPGISEVIEDGWTGRLITSHDPLWFAGAIETLLDNTRLRMRMARSARERLEHDFSLPRNASFLARLFAQVTTQRKLTIHELA
jgi:glycosyltransferase involved in cell wall biosynthesis